MFKAAKALIDVIKGHAKEAYPLKDRRPIRLLIYVDESHAMTTEEETFQNDGRNAYQTLCSSLNELLGLDIFVVFLSTNSSLQEYSPSRRIFWSSRGRDATLSYAQTPYTELPFDIWKATTWLLRADIVLMLSARWNSWCDLVDLCASILFGIFVIEAFIDFAIPCRWWALWEVGDKVVRDGIIELARSKLAARNAGKYEANSFLAALSVRLMLEFEPRRIRATEVENLMVAGHPRVANVIPDHREYVISSTPSEPIVAEAAAQVLRGQDMVHLLAQNVTEGLIEKGQRGELVARLLLTLAHDRALERMTIPHRDYQGRLEKLYTTPIPVIAFFCALFSQQHLTSYSIVVRMIAPVVQLSRRHLRTHTLCSLILARLPTTGACHTHSCLWRCAATWRSLVERGCSTWTCAFLSTLARRTTYPGKLQVRFLSPSKTKRTPWAPIVHLWTSTRWNSNNSSVYHPYSPARHSVQRRGLPCQNYGDAS